MLHCDFRLGLAEGLSLSLLDIRQTNWRFWHEMDSADFAAAHYLSRMVKNCAVAATGRSLCREPFAPEAAYSQATPGYS